MKLYQSEEDGKLIVYQTENKKDIEVYVAENTIWLTQSQIADLFVTTPQNVTIHIRNIFKDRELEKASTCKDFLQIQQEGNRQVSRVRQFYNLDIILSVGYRVKSVAATRFRIWERSYSHSPGWIFRRKCWYHNGFVRRSVACDFSAAQIPRL